MQSHYDHSDDALGKEANRLFADPTVSSYSTLSGGSTAELRLSSTSMRETAQENPLMAIGCTSGIDASLKSSRVLQELTINKLRYHEVGMIGRERECQKLEECMDRMMTNMSKELIFIKGESGAGKSIFANSIETKVKENGRTGAYARGKFDLNANIHEPCSAIAMAFGKLCIQVNMDPEQQVGGKLLEELGSDAAYQLAELVPEVLMMLPPDNHHCDRELDSLSRQDQHEFEANQKRWENAFRVLARVFCSKFSPLIITLDDLQWADEYSWNIIDLLLSDTENSSNAFMVTGCFRSEHLNMDDSLLQKSMENLAAKAPKRNFQVTQIELGSLNTEQTNQIIMALLNIDDDSRTAPLAKLCYRRTLGNPHFVVEFVTTLDEEELITFNLGTLQWQWNVDTIEEKTMSTKNVVDLLQARMSKLPKQFQLLLQYAACLGTPFRKDVLSGLWLKHTGNEDTHDLISMLALLESSHFLESFGAQQYRWTHDKVKEATLAMRRDERSLFQSEVGEALLFSLGENELGDMLFQVIDLINTGVPAQRLDYARLNLRAAKKARGIAAFASAGNYARKGIAWLPDDKWDLDFQSTLQLYTIATEMELGLGNTQNVEAYSQEVLNQPKCSALNKTPMYMSKAYEQLNITVKPKEAIATILIALKGLGVSLFRLRPLLPVDAVVSLIKTIRLAKRTPKSTYESLPVMTDKKLIAITRCLSKVIYAAYMAKDNFLQVLSIVRLAKMTLKHGISGATGFAFSTLGLFTIVIMKDVQSATYFAEMALLMQNKSPDKFGEASTIFTVNKYVFPWTIPNSVCTRNLKAGYQKGASAGDVVMGMWAHANYTIFNPLHDGFPLPMLKERCIKFLALADELKQDLHGSMVKIKLQGILNLMDLDDETTEMSGSVCNFEDIDMEMFGKNVHFMNTMLLVYFREYDEAAKLFMKHGDAQDKAFPGNLDGMHEAFLRGIALYAMARKTKKRKYKRHANNALQKIEAWIKRGNPNINLYYGLLCAERASLSKDYKGAHTKYREVITSAARSGNLYMAALANERYADYFENVIMDIEEYEYRMDETIRFYRRWGAYAKVKQLIDLRHRSGVEVAAI